MHSFGFNSCVNLRLTVSIPASTDVDNNGIPEMGRDDIIIIMSVFANAFQYNINRQRWRIGQNAAKEALVRFFTETKETTN